MWREVMTRHCVEEAMARTHAGVDHENGEDGQNPAPAE